MAGRDRFITDDWDCKGTTLNDTTSNGSTSNGSTLSDTSKATGTASREGTLETVRQWAAQPRCSADWIEITQPRIDGFAASTGDDYWLHTDPARARDEGPFGGTIAHGFLLLSMTIDDDVVQITRLPGVVHVLNYGLDKVRFLSPVPCGARIRVHSQVESLVEKHPGQWLLRQVKRIEVQGQAGPALVAEQLSLLRLA